MRNVVESRIEMDSRMLQELFTEVKETIATDYVVNNPKSKKAFGAADMWNIRRKGVNATSQFRNRTTLTSLT